MKRFIKNLRYGFATNSSSVHSIVLIEGDIRDRNTPNYEYGWDPFILQSSKEKQNYLKTQLLENMRQLIGSKAAHKFLSEFGGHFPENAAIDHQSIISLPVKPNTNEIEFEFFEDLKAFVLRDDVSILGGNDNEENPLRALCEKELKLIPDLMLDTKTRFWARRNGNYWYLIDPKDGTRLRIAFETEEKPLIATMPELIDLKITDFCQTGCPFCYQNSSVFGKHADFEQLKKIIRAIPAGTEVAIGGGDPMSHPQIVEILKVAKRAGLIVNLTVREIDWLKDPALLAGVRESVSAIGLSIDGPEDLLKATQINNNLPDVAVNLHYIPDLHDFDNLRNIMRALSDFAYAATNNYGTFSKSPTLVLLGFKETGRGVSAEHHTIPNFVEELMRVWQEAPYVSIGVDTKFIKDYPEIKEKVDGVYLTLHEGEFSMYIDGVKGTAYRSSYSLEDEVKLTPKLHYPHDATITDVFCQLRSVVTND